jgi:hypothetical protein
MEETLNIINYVGNSLYLLFGLFSILTCTLLFYICIYKCDKKASEIKLIIIFCIIECITGIEFLLISVFKLSFGYTIFNKGKIGCRIVAFALSGISRLSIWNIAILSTLRYLIVCHCKELKLWIWLTISALVFTPIVVIYCLGFYTDDASPAPSYLFCQTFVQPNEISMVLGYLIPFLYIIPCWITTYCYFGVGWKANKQLNLMKMEAKTNSDQNLLKTIQKERLKLYLQLIFVFFIYNVNFSVSYITWIMKLISGYKRPSIVDAIIAIQVNSTVAINPVVTIIFQPDINCEFKIIWVKWSLKIKNLAKKVGLN